MTILKDLKPFKRFTLLQYGETGAGKSMRAASAAIFGPIFIFDFDNKISSVYEWYKDKPTLLDNIHFETYADHGGKISGCQRAYAKLREFWSQISEGAFPYATIVWDSWTTWEMLYMNQVMASNPRFERMSTEVYKDPKTGKSELIACPQKADYRIHAHNQAQFITDLMHLPCNIIVNAHISIREDEHTGKLEYGMAAAGKLSKHLPKFFTEVHRCHVQKSLYRIQVKSSSQWPCNTRLKSGISDDGMIDNDIELLRPMALTKGDSHDHKKD